MLIVDDRVESGYDFCLLEEIAASLSEKEIELILTDNQEIRQLNKEHRGKDKATDVLSFPIEDIPFMPLGMVVISVDKVKEKALELGHSEKEELALLFIHGVLHLLGFDHETDSGEMRKKEHALIKKYDLPNSLIIRSQ